MLTWKSNYGVYGTNWTKDETKYGQGFMQPLDEYRLPVVKIEFQTQSSQNIFFSKIRFHHL